MGTDELECNVRSIEVPWVEVPVKDNYTNRLYAWPSSCGDTASEAIFPLPQCLKDAISVFANKCLLSAKIVNERLSVPA